MSKNGNLFFPVIAKAPHIAFERLRSSLFHRGARALMNQLFLEMGDPDGNFISDFQGPGFHSRMFELACFAYLREDGWDVDRRQKRPDFLARSESLTVAFEAVTLNPTNGREQDIAVMHVKPISDEEALEKVNEELAVRAHSALLRKIQEHYWDEPCCAGHPFVLFMAPFQEAGSTSYIDANLARYLYGAERHLHWTEVGGVLRRETPVRAHTLNGRGVVSNFFGSEPGAENISAILWCNQFTVPKFFRVAADIFGLLPGTRANVSGFYAREAKFIEEYRYALGAPGVPAEEWARGVTALLNPHARFPLDPETLGCTSVFEVRSGLVARGTREFHPLTAFMDDL